jgi:O-antigen ligase
MVTFHRSINSVSHVSSKLKNYIVYWLYLHSSLMSSISIPVQPLKTLTYLTFTGCYVYLSWFCCQFRKVGRAATLQNFYFTSSLVLTCKVQRRQCGFTWWHYCKERKNIPVLLGVSCNCKSRWQFAIFNSHAESYFFMGACNPVQI